MRRSISVNMSRIDIQKGQSIADYFLDLINKYDLTPDQLRIEITETAYAEDPGMLIKTTEELRSSGFRVEMDDFGSGYSSLNMLNDVHVDCIKLDLKFLNINDDPERCRTIVGHIVQMANDLGMDIIAEGVETEVQAEFLHSIGCSKMQGFWYYKPMPVPELEKTDKWNLYKTIDI